MKLKESGGRIIHSQLSFAFNMLELGGSDSQKFNTINGEYIPNRRVTPYALKPSLGITDPDGNYPDGDYASYLTNVNWEVWVVPKNGPRSLLSMPDCEYNTTTKVFLINANTNPDTIMEVSFSADFLNRLNNRVSQFKWKKTLTTLPEAQYNLSLEVDCPVLLNLSPFKRRGAFRITPQLKNGSEIIDATFEWKEWDDKNNAWVTIDTDENLAVEDVFESGHIFVNQDYIDLTRLKVAAWPTGHPDMKKEYTIKLKRFYGNYDERLDITEGQFIRPGDTVVHTETVVVNKSGNINNPEQYFDIETFYMDSDEPEWQLIGYGVYAQIRKTHIPDGHRLGHIVRELTALQAIELPDGSVLANDDGSPIVAQFPIGTIEF